VIIAALRLLDRLGGPVVIEDFPDDDLRQISDPHWRPPPSAGLGGTLGSEIVLLDGPYRRSVAPRGRTTVGLSGLPIAAAAAYLAAWQRGENPQSPVAGMSPALALRFATDDLREDDRLKLIAENFLVPALRAGAAG
jgi:hypothetical protein